MLPTLALSTALLLAAAALLAWHWSAWKAARDAAAEAAERDFAWSQFRRRAQATAMLGVLALLMLASIWLEHMPHWVFAVYIITMLVLVAWMILLAVADMVASRQHYAFAQTKNFAEQARLKAELYRLKEEAKHDHSHGNGKARKM